MRSVYGQSNDHVQATYEMQTGQIRMGFPSVGSWVTYGLGSENASLPGYVVLHDARGGPLGGVNDWTLRLHAGGVPGHAVPLDRRSDRRPEAAGGRQRRSSSARGSICWRS